jgi:DNA-binding winged helix-turn-helix (wHTH) protein/CheY-like chemotaxis protein
VPESESCEVTCQDQTISLTATEYGVLELLTRHPQRIFSQAYLLERLWQAKEMPTENTVRSHIKALRQKLKKAGAGDVIETVYGLGYRLKEVIEEQGAAIGSLESKELGEVGEEIQTPNPQSLTSNSLPQNLVTIWEKHRGQYAERLQVILDAIAQLATGDLNPDLQLRAGREAHTLVGSLGSFNLHQMAQLGVLEQHFKSPSLSSTQASSLSELATILSQLIHHGLVESKTEQIVQNSKQTLQHSKQSIQKSAAGIHSTKEPFPTIQVLIVENDLTLATAIETEAIRWGIQVEIAPTPAVARTLVSKSWPDVILLDLTTSETE